MLKTDETTKTSIVKQFSKELSSLDNGTFYDDERFKEFLISTFDHVLREDDFKNEDLLCYADVLITEHLRNKYLCYEERYIALYENLFHKYKFYCYIIEYDKECWPEHEGTVLGDLIPDKNNPFWRCDDLDEFLQIIREGIRETKGYLFFMPDCKCLINICFYMVNSVVYQSYADILPLKNDIEKHGLFALSLDEPMSGKS